MRTFPTNIISKQSDFFSTKQTENARAVRLVEFETWAEAKKAGFQTRSQWRKVGKGVRDRSTAFIEWKGERRSLYHENQTTALKPKTLAVDRLIDRFVGRTDVFGYQRHGRHGEWSQESNYRWDARSLIKQGFNHRRCHDQGIRMGRMMAQAFSVRSGENTSFFVVDVDCHNPTSVQVGAHLRLVEVLQAKLPELLEHLGGGSIFYQYRQIETSGIQFWVTLNRPFYTQHLHETVRAFLSSLDEELDQELRQVGLSGLDEIEIRPTETQLISVPGCYGKTVFTDRELKLVDGWFDVIGLDEHIESQRLAGNVFPRYEALLKANWDHRVKRAPKSPIRPSRANGASLILSLDSLRKDGSRYWTDLKRVAIEGVTIPDRLYQNYLQPLGQCLYFRDFAHRPDRETLVANELFDWVLAKSNGLVSRIEKEGELRRVCCALAKSLEKKTCKSVKDYYRSMLMKDLLYPHRIEHLYEYMRAEAKQNTIPCIYCKCSLSQSVNAVDSITRPMDDSPLPSLIARQIEVIGEQLRKGKVRQRFTTFARNFLNEIWSGDNSEKNISWQRINVLMGKPSLKSRQTQDKYKKLLLHHGLIRGDWEKYIRRGAYSSRYRLTEWACQQFMGCRGAVAAAG